MGHIQFKGRVVFKLMLILVYKVFWGTGILGPCILLIFKCTLHHLAPPQTSPCLYEQEQIIISDNEPCLSIWIYESFLPVYGFWRLGTGLLLI